MGSKTLVRLLPYSGVVELNPEKKNTDLVYCLNFFTPFMDFSVE